MVVQDDLADMYASVPQCLLFFPHPRRTLVHDPPQKPADAGHSRVWHEVLKWPDWWGAHNYEQWDENGEN